MHHLNNDPFLTPRGLQHQIPELRKVSKETIRQCIMKDFGLPSRTAAVKPHLTDWAQRRWSKRRWRKVLWSDETHIELWKGFQHTSESADLPQSPAMTCVLFAA